MDMMRREPPPALVGVLFAEDFDDATGVTVIEAPAEPEVIAPVFSAADLESAHARAYADGRAAGLGEAAATHDHAAREALADIARALETAGAELAGLAADHADEVARLLLDTLMTLLPATCARHAEAEVRAVARAVLPALQREAAVTVRAHPRTAGAIAEEIERLDPELAARIRLLPADHLAASDIRIGWADGGAVRDTDAAWREIAEVLEQSGLRVRAESAEDTTDVR